MIELTTNLIFCYNNGSSRFFFYFVDYISSLHEIKKHIGVSFFVRIFLKKQSGFFFPKMNRNDKYISHILIHVVTK